MEVKRRIAERELLAVPVTVSGYGTGMTRDVSLSGLYFSIDGTVQPGAQIDFRIALDIHGQPLTLVGQGEVVRVEAQGRRSGVAVRMLASQLQAAG